MTFDNKEIIKYINNHCITKDFPVPGVNFVDIFPLLRHTCLYDVQEHFNITEPIIFTPEARGFLFMDVLGLEKCIPIRKAGKLPGELVHFSATKEYGKDELYFQVSALNELIKEDSNTHIHEVVFFDDILATGGTAKSFIDFIESYHIGAHSFKVTRCCFYIELTALKGRDVLSVPVDSVYKYE